jgi:hypothetical protein
MSLSIVTEAFCIGCHVMAGLQYNPDNGGAGGLLFESYEDQTDWQGRAEYGFINVIPAGVFNGFNGDDTLTSTDYISVGGTAVAQIGYPSSNELVAEDYIDEWGNPAVRLVNSENPTNIDLSLSPSSKFAFGQITSSGNTAGFDSNNWTYYQFGDCPVGQTQTSLSVSGSQSSYSYSATFPLIEGESYSPWATSYEKESNSVWVSAFAPGGGTNFQFPGAPVTRVKTYSGSFTYSPSQYFA